VLTKTAPVDFWVLGIGKMCQEAVHSLHTAEWGQQTPSVPPEELAVCA
jgi:hypothetical protein